jgi:hypothetical protein
MTLATAFNALRHVYYDVRTESIRQVAGDLLLAQASGRGPWRVCPAPLADLPAFALIEAIDQFDGDDGEELAEFLENKFWPE